MLKKILSLLLLLTILLGCTSFEYAESTEDDYYSRKQYIETTLNLKNNPEQTWNYSASSDAWTLSVVSAVAYPELADNEGVSVCVPGAYIIGIDTNGDGTADVTSSDGGQSAQGSLVIDYNATVTSTNGQVYAAATAPMILNTGAAGYGSATNTTASASYAAEGYINISCGNRGKQSTAVDVNGNTYYTGDAPSCLADQKAAARFIKYNVLLGNLPGDVNRLISTGGSGGGAHAAMFAATGNNPAFYAYQEEVGAVGVYRNAAGEWITTVNVNGEEVSLSDAAWGCIAYSAITSLYEADMAMAFEYSLDATYEFGSAFQTQLAAYLSEAYMSYINEQELTVEESAVGFDLDGDGAMNSTIALSIECDPNQYPETNGYHGTYLDLYLAEFQQNLTWYMDNLEYAEGWSWFDADGNAMTDEQVCAMTAADKADAFLEGRYAASSGNGITGGRGNMGGEKPSGVPSGLKEGPNGMGSIPGDMSSMPADAGNPPDSLGGAPDSGDGIPPDMDGNRGFVNADVAANSKGDVMDVGTPDAGTTQAAGSSTDSKNYTTYNEMLASYALDIAEIYNNGDRFCNNQVVLYNPLNFIGADDTDGAAWVRIMMGASEGDISLFNSLNLQIALLNAGTDAEIQWQWNGGHVPSEIFGESFSLYVDQMVAKYDKTAAQGIGKTTAEPQKTNGTAAKATGTDISSYVTLDDDGTVSFSLAYAAKVRTGGASKAIPGFDVIDYGQEDYVFGSADKDARHWNDILLNILTEHQDVLEPLFNQE